MAVIPSKGEVKAPCDATVSTIFDTKHAIGLATESGLDGNDNELKKLNLEGYERMINNVVEKYPNLKMVATTLREVKTATVNDWGAICWAEGRIYNSKRYENLEILDRVGGGDSFASGLIYGMLTTGDPETALELGVAHGALAMTTPGDTSMANRKEVEAVMRGAGARVKR